MAIYAAALRRAADGAAITLDVVRVDGSAVASVDPLTWTMDARPGDGGILDRCQAATLDVGCGPGRLVAALRQAGRIALGVDISAEAVRQARRRGAWALRRNVFGPIPGHGRWDHVLLADGNIGIGGDPERLLLRCGQLLAAAGTVLVETSPPGTPTWSGSVILRDRERQSAAFPWATVAADDLGPLAHRCGLREKERWQEAGRWFAHLTRR
jgi:SAM-dependent methyltransferase